MNITHDFGKAYLFLCTADSAVKNLSAQIASTKAYIAWNSLHGYHSQHGIYKEGLETEEDDLRLWEERLLEAQVGFVEWAACRAMGGKILPPEIGGIIRSLIDPPWYAR